MARFQSKYADPDCRECFGRGETVERGRHYGDAKRFTTCDCFDRAAAARDEDAFRAQCRADRDEADRLMSEVAPDESLTDLDDIRAMRAEISARRTALTAARNIILVCVIAPALAFVATKGAANIIHPMWEARQ